MFKFSIASKNRLKGVDDGLVEVAHRALILTPIDFGIAPHGGKRDAPEQHDLFVHGKSKADGYIKKSRHQYGLALDFYAYLNREASWEPQHLSLVAAAWLQAACEFKIGVEWGGLWKRFVDMPHIQRSDIPLTDDLL